MEKGLTVVLGWMGALAAFMGFGAPRLTLAGGTDFEIATGDASAVKRWARDLIVEAPRHIFWGRFFGTGDDAIIQEDKTLEKAPGDKLTFYFGRKLSGAGVTGDTTMEGSEELPATYSDDVTLEQYRNAVRLKGKLSERRTMYSQQAYAQGILKTWMAEKIDDFIFTQFDSSPSTIVYGGDATSTATIDSGDKFTLALLDRLKAKAAKASPKIWPTKVGGKPYFVFGMHTDVEYDLARDAEYQQLQREAGPSGDDNNLFTGMLGIYRGNVLHSHEKFPVTNTGGADSLQPWASCFHLGAQAGLFSFGNRPEWFSKSFDYGNSVGFAIAATWGFTKSVFNSVDLAFQAARVYRTNV